MFLELSNWIILKCYALIDLSNEIGELIVLQLVEQNTKVIYIQRSLCARTGGKLTTSKHLYDVGVSIKILLSLPD